MTYSAIQVANRFIEVAQKKNRQEKLDPSLGSVTKLIKLVYIAHGWHLAITGQSLIHENVEAWKYGPVVERIYNDFYSQKGGDKLKPVPTQEAEIELDPTAEMIIRMVYGKYKEIDYKELSGLTHMPGTPWDQVTDRPDFHFYDVIPNVLIKEYYEQFIEP